MRQEGVPQGKVTQMPAWHSKIFPGTVRDWWIYVPAQYVPGTPAPFIVAQDGYLYLNRLPRVRFVRISARFVALDTRDIGP